MATRLYAQHKRNALPTAGSSEMGRGFYHSALVPYNDTQGCLLFRKRRTIFIPKRLSDAILEEDIAQATTSRHPRQLMTPYATNK